MLKNCETINSISAEHPCSKVSRFFSFGKLVKNWQSYELLAFLPTFPKFSYAHLPLLFCNFKKRRTARKIWTTHTYVPPTCRSGGRSNPTDQSTDHPTDRPATWPADWPTEHSTDRPTIEPTNLPTMRQTDRRPTSRPTDSSSEHPTDWSSDRLTTLPTDWPTDHLTERSPSRPPYQLVDCVYVQYRFF